MRRTSRAAVFAGILLVAGCFLAHFVKPVFPFSSARMSDSTTILQLGAPKLSHLSGTGISVDRHPTGINFYQKEFSQGSHGAVEFLGGSHSFTIENVLSAVGTEDMDVPGGISKWTILFGPTDQQADTPEVARDRLMQLFARLRAAGWKRYIDVDDPRLAGRQAWQYGTTGSASGVYSLDSTYMPTIDEWESKAAAMPSWVFHADGIYIKVFVQASNMGGFVGKSTYLISADVMNEYEFYGVGFFSGHEDKIRDWKKLLPAELQKNHATRLKTEASLKAQGYTIDTTYQDPPIQTLQASPANPQ